MRAGYDELRATFDPSISVKLYNDSLFHITSLTGRYQYLIEVFERRKENKAEL
jgi:hypothetical protein